MKIAILAVADAVANKAAEIIAAAARTAVAARGRFVVAVSGGRTPWVMLRALAGEDVPWQAAHVVQVDERVAPAGDPDRNLTHLNESLLEHAPLRREQIYAMPVEAAELAGTAERYATTLQKIAGTPAVLDLVHLGLGEDGPTHQPVEHLASLRAIPGLVTLRPADANEVVEAYRYIMKLHHEPAVLVLSRQALPTLDRSKYAPASGVGRGAYVLADAPGGNPEVILRN